MSKIGKAAAAALILMLILVGAAISRSSSGGGRRSEKSFTEAEQAARYPFRQLNAREKALYRTLYAGIENYEDRIALPYTYTDQEYERVYLMLTMQEPQFFYVDKVYELSDKMDTAVIHYLFGEEEAERIRGQLEARAESMLSRISPTQSEVQKLMMLHDLIAERCQYSDFLFSGSVYGCLINGMALCEGYAKTFVYLARKLGLEAMCVTGKSSRDVLHVWNIAKIDGAYYNIDVTWDDDDTYQGGIPHCCFAMPDRLFTDHIPDETAFTPPPCSGMEMTYYQQRGYQLAEASQLNTSLSAWSMQRNGQLLEFRCANEGVFVEVRERLQRDPEIGRILRQNGMHDGARIFLDPARQIAVVLPEGHGYF
ncbi:MAG: hypothetical protein II723_03730 [Oscillospiraceae bacterium]|nr:hypothetical protein [Oscillospiraceae bacterium]